MTTINTSSIVSVEVPSYWSELDIAGCSSHDSHVHDLNMMNSIEHHIRMLTVDVMNKISQHYTKKRFNALSRNRIEGVLKWLNSTVAMMRHNETDHFSSGRIELIEESTYFLMISMIADKVVSTKKAREMCFSVHQELSSIQDMKWLSKLMSTDNKALEAVHKENVSSLKGYPLAGMSPVTLHFVCAINMDSWARDGSWRGLKPLLTAMAEYNNVWYSYRAGNPHSDTQRVLHRKLSKLLKQGLITPLDAIGFLPWFGNDTVELLVSSSLLNHLDTTDLVHVIKTLSVSSQKERFGQFHLDELVSVFHDNPDLPYGLAATMVIPDMLSNDFNEYKVRDEFKTEVKTSTMNRMHYTIGDYVRLEYLSFKTMKA